MIKFPHFGIWLPLGGSHIPKWQKRGGPPWECSQGGPRYFLSYLPNYLLTSVDRVVS